jgi:hypothetical protein
MKKMHQKILVVALIVVFGFSCSNTGNTETSKTDSTVNVQKSEPVNSLPDISGVYKLPDGGCKLALTIKKENNVFKYNFTGEHLDLEGIAIVNKIDSDIYIVFDGPVGNTPPKTVEALYKDNTLTIQNDGNAENQYHYFECDEKYLEFKKN